MEIYYEDYRLRVVKNEYEGYDIYDSKYHRITHKNVSKERADERVSSVLSKRSKRLL